MCQNFIGGSAYERFGHEAMHLSGASAAVPVADGHLQVAFPQHVRAQQPSLQQYAPRVVICIVGNGAHVAVVRHLVAPLESHHVAPLYVLGVRRRHHGLHSLSVVSLSHCRITFFSEHGLHGLGEFILFDHELHELHELEKCRLT